MSKSKRFECVFVEDDEFGGTFRRLKDNEMNITYMVCDVADLLNFQNTQIKILKDENEQLKEEIRAYPINEQYAEEIMQQNQKLRIERNDLRRENRELKQKLENIGLNEKNDTVKMIDGKFFIKM